VPRSRGVWIGVMVMASAEA